MPAQREIAGVQICRPIVDVQDERRQFLLIARLVQPFLDRLAQTDADTATVLSRALIASAGSAVLVVVAVVLG